MLWQCAVTVVHSYNVSKVLVSQLLVVLTSPFIIPDMFSFLEDLCSCNFDDSNMFMVDFNVNSLFTNVLLDKTIDIIIRLLAILSFFMAFQFLSKEF